MNAQNKLYVGNLNWNTTETSLHELFSQFGNVLETRIILEHETGRSRGFGFITFEEKQAASNALEKLNDFFFEGRTLSVNRAVRRKRKN